MKKQRIIELAVKVIVAALTAFLTARGRFELPYIDKICYKYSKKFGFSLTFLYLCSVNNCLSTIVKKENR